jgi:hypothetical protein
MAAVVSVVNRNNQIFEAEVAVRLILIANNNLLIYLDGTTDPYTDNSTPDLLDENQATLPGVIGGDGNYDIGHVLNSTGSGQAGGSNVCNDGSKARGTSAIRGTGPLDNQSVYHTAHEIGHQFGAGHIWNGIAGNCNPGNYSASNAYEPGSGTSIMGYPGTCGTDNIRVGKEAYFHRRNLDTMIAFIDGGTPCAVTAASGNTPPQVNAGTDIVVPVSTPFKLKANGSDVNGDTIYYCWEQFDPGTGQRALGSADNGTDPQFRSVFPSVNPARYFPVNPATPTTAEVLFTVPDVDRNFVVTARDFRSGGGGTNDDALVVKVIDAPAAPFRVTVGNTAGEVWTGTTRMITWDVAGTDTLPFNIFNVNIMMSVDGGDSYPYMLKENTPNDGSQLVLLPNVNSNQVRIRVEPVDSGVFDISDADIIVGGHIEINPVVMDFGLVCAGDEIDRQFEIFNTGSGDLTISSISLSGGAGSFTLVPSNALPQPGIPVVIQPGQHVNYTVHFVAPNICGPVTANVNIQSSDLSRPSVDVTATATVGEPEINTMVANNGSFGDVCLGDIKDLNILISNSGNCNLMVTSINSSSAEFVVPNVITFPLIVQGGTSMQVPIRFQPTSLGPKNATITINSNDISEPSVNVSVSGNVPGGDISVTPCPLDFGVVCADNAAALMKEVTVCNTGKCPLSVGGITISGMDFQLEGVPGLPVTVQSGSCFTFTVKFTPTSAGPKSATLTINSDDPDSPVISCDVTGETAVSSVGVPPRIPYQPTVISTVGHCPSDEPLAVVNTGMCNLKVTTVSISGINAASFSFVGLPSSSDPLTLLPGEQLGDGSLYVRFAPAQMLTERFHQAQVNVTYIKDPFSLEEETVTVPVMGEAVQNGFRLLVRAGGVPVDNVLKIKATVKGLKANGKKAKVNLNMKNATLRKVDAPAPFKDDLSFVYQAEFGALTNSAQLPTGECLMKVQYRIGKKKVTKTIRFQTLDTCTFNQDVIADF